MPKPTERFYLDCDDDGHWYLIPVKRRDDFSEWLSQDWQAPLANFITPPYATEVDNPHYVTFEAPEDES